MKKLLGLLVLLVMIGGFVLLPNEITDRINPLVAKQEVFVQINEAGTPRSPGGYDYTLIGFTKDGNKQTVTFYASGKLREEAFLKIYTKGEYVETWEEVQPEELPAKVKERF